MASAPSQSGGGTRQQRAAELRAEDERKKQAEEQAAAAESEPREAAAETPAPSGEAPTSDADAVDDTAVTGAEPSGEATTHVAKAWDCMNKIADQYGFFWETLWNDSSNAGLKSRRGDPNVLFAGDEVVIREKQRKDEPGATEQHHRFRKLGTPARLIMQLLEEDEPQANQPYHLDIDGRIVEGDTDADGVIDVPVPNRARRGTLVVGSEGAETSYQLDLGHLHPRDTTEGAQHRLLSLGYDAGRVDGRLGSVTRAAIRTFQLKNKLPETSGALDEDTCKALNMAHGS